MSDHAILVFLLVLHLVYLLGCIVFALVAARAFRPLWRALRGLSNAWALKDPLTWALLASIGALMFLPGCASSGGAVEAIVNAWEQINADGRVTPEEREWFASLLSNAIGERGSIDWPATLLGIVPTVAGLFGLNIYRNNRERKVWGPPPAAPAAPETRAA